MALNIISLWNFGSTYCGIDFNTSLEGKNSISALTATIKKDEFIVGETFFVTSLDAITKRLKRNQHFFLCITGSTVLVKSTPITGIASKVVTSAFPNIDLEEFYYEILKVPSGNLVALCRKDHVDRIIYFFEKLGHNTVGFSLAFTSIQNLLHEIKEKEIFLSSFKITVKEKNIDTFERIEPDSKKHKVCTIGDTNISSEYLLSLSVLFNYPGIIHSETNFTDRNRELRKGHLQKVFFRKGLATAVSGLLLMLLINFMIYFSYHSKLTKMNGSYEQEQSRREKYNNKNQVVSNKNKIVENIFKNSNSCSSLYLNQFIKSKPGSVLLERFNFQPLKKQIRENEPIQLENNIILIAGETEDENDFSHWIKNLEVEEWINEVTVSNFSYQTDGTSNFLLKIKFQKNETIN